MSSYLLNFGETVFLGERERGKRRRRERGIWLVASDRERKVVKTGSLKKEVCGMESGSLLLLFLTTPQPSLSMNGGGQVSSTAQKRKGPFFTASIQV